MLFLKGHLRSQVVYKIKTKGLDKGLVFYLYIFSHDSTKPIVVGTQKEYFSLRRFHLSTNTIGFEYQIRVFDMFTDSPYLADRLNDPSGQ